MLTQYVRAFYLQFAPKNQTLIIIHSRNTIERVTSILLLVLLN